jgi:hypothetical protein
LWPTLRTLPVVAALVLVGVQAAVRVVLVVVEVLVRETMAVLVVGWWEEVQQLSRQAPDQEHANVVRSWPPTHNSGRVEEHPLISKTIKPMYKFSTCT